MPTILAFFKVKSGGHSATLRKSKGYEDWVALDEF